MKVNDLTNAVNAYENVRNEADEVAKRHTELSDKAHKSWISCREQVSEYLFDKIYECMKAVDDYKSDETWKSKYCTKFVSTENTPIYVTKPNLASSWIDESSGVVHAWHWAFIDVYSDDKLTVYYPILIDMIFDYKRNETLFKRATHLVGDMHITRPHGGDALLHYCYCALSTDSYVDEETFCEWLTDVMTEPFKTNDDFNNFIERIVVLDK